LKTCVDLPPNNAEIAELLSLEASKASYVLRRAYRRAARSAFLWEAQARDLVARKQQLTQLSHVGPFLEKQITMDSTETASTASAAIAEGIFYAGGKPSPSA
jgi:DNA polymerase/3'-5' exonuclease PolX